MFLLSDLLVCFTSQEKKRESKSRGTEEAKAAQPSNAAQVDSSNTQVVEEKEIHVDTEEKREQQPDSNDNINGADETPPHQVAQPSNEAVLQDMSTSVQPPYQLSYSIYPAASCDDPWYDAPPAYYNPSMSENPPYYPYDARCCPNQSDSSGDDFAHQLADKIFAVQFYYH